MRWSWPNVVVKGLRSGLWLVAGVWAGVLVGTVAAAQETPSARGGLFGDGFNALERVLDSQARLVFYWPQALVSTQAATVLVNGTYQATLTPGGYSLLCLAPQTVKVGAKLVGSGSRGRDDGAMGAEIDLQPGQTRYFRVRTHEEGALTLESVQPVRARLELQATREQVHTLSRVTAAQVCQDFGPSPSPSPPPSQGAGLGASSR